jgi:predicted ATP-grasp superfamily ATP-dependent carboligase
VLLTDADSRISLAALRALGRRGYRVDVMGTAHGDAGFHSRFCRARLRHDPPERDFAAYARLLVETAACGRYDVLLCMSDWAALVASRHRDDLSPAVGTVVPSYDTLMATRDKARTLSIAEELDIEVPRTFVLSNIAELPEVAEAAPYPCVIKLRQGAGAAGLRYARSPDELLACYRSEPTDSNAVFDYELPLVQEYVSGKIHDVCVLFDRGEPVATLTQRRLRTWPVDGGRGILNETTDEPELAEKAVRLLRDINWHGPAQVEFKMDTRTGRPVLMEVNGRFWGALALSVEAGVDFPHLTCLLATGQTLPGVPDYPVGLRYAWLVPFALAHVVNGPGRLRAAADFTWAALTGGCDVQPTDPLPSLAALARSARGWRELGGNGSS